MPSLNRTEIVTCEICGTQTTKLNLARHKMKCSARTLHCTQCPNFSTTAQKDLLHQILKKHSATKLDVTVKCKLRYEQFQGFYALSQQQKPNMAFLSRQQMLNLTVSSMKTIMPTLNRRCVHVYVSP